MKLLFVILFTLGLGTTFLGCAKDQSSDDYLNLQVERDFARFSAATGAYTGKLTHPKTGAVMAGVSLNLITERVTEPSNGSGHDLQKAAMKTTVDFSAGANKVNVEFTNTTYIPDTGNITADVQIPLSAAEIASGQGDTADFKLEGQISISNEGKHFSGRMYVSGDEDLAYQLELDSNGESITSISSSLPGFVDSGQSGAISGVMTIPNDSSADVAVLTVTDPTLIGANVILDYFLEDRIKTVAVSLTGAIASAIPISSGFYDEDKFTLSPPTAPANTQFSLNCPSFQLLTGFGDFTCSLTTPKGTSFVYFPCDQSAANLQALAASPPKLTAPSAGHACTSGGMSVNGL